MSTNFHSPISIGAPANASIVNAPFSELDDALTNLINGDQAWTQLNHGAPTTLTIAAGIVTVTQTYHTVDTQGGAGTDDLDTINGGQVGDVLYLSLADASRIVTVKNGTGNIYLSGLSDFTFSSANQVIALFCLGSVWVDGSGDASPGSFTRLVNMTTLGASAANIDLTGLSQDYSLLLVRAGLRSDAAGVDTDNVLVRFNGDTTAANYFSIASATNTGGLASSENLGASAGVRILRGATGATASAGYRTALEFTVYNYVPITYPRQMCGKGYYQGSDVTSNLYTLAFGGVWKNTAAAINRITLLPVSGANFVAGSFYEVYGIL